VPPSLLPVRYPGNPSTFFAERRTELRQVAPVCAALSNPQISTISA
jgi:hypothetical protein